MWPSVTHLGSGSGGSWFSSQFCFSQSFYEAVVSESPSISGVVAQWGEAYANRLLAEQHNSSGVHPLPGHCHVFAAAVDGIMNKAFDLAKMPSSKWYPYTISILKGTIGGVDAGRTYEERTGLKTATLCQMASLPPDAYVGSADGSISSVGVRVDGREIQYSVPLGFAADPLGNVEWSDHSNYTLGPTLLPLPLPANPTIGTVTAASSAAMGAICSKTMVEQLVAHIFDFAVRDCLWETDLEALAVPTDGSGSKAIFPQSYRFLDGGYTDNSAAAMAIARMQRDCDFGGDGNGGGSGNLDCSAMPRLVIVDHDAKGDTSIGPQKSEFFSSSRLFQPPAGTATINHWSAVQTDKFLAPLATVFNEPFPPLSAFQSYSAGGVSKFWNGTLTTVDNAFYGVTGGQRVRVALFSPLFNEPLTPALDEHGILTHDHVAAYTALFNSTYANRAEAQAVAIRPLLHEFLTAPIEPDLAGDE